MLSVYLVDKFKFVEIVFIDLSFNQIKYKLKTEKNMSNAIYGSAGMSKT